MSTSSPSTNASHRPTALVATIVLVVIALVVAAFLLLRGDGTGGDQAAGPRSTASPTTTTQTTPATPRTTSSSESATTGATTTPPARANALAQLEPFFAAAARMDGQLRAAALEINAAGPPWYSLSEDVARTVRAVDIDDVARTIPGGMPTPLLTSVMAVYHDLSARQAAMDDFSFSRPYEEPNESDDAPMSTKNILANLSKGAAPAARFAADLAGARSQASSTAPFQTAARGSRADMEVRLHIEAVFKGNFGCGAHGSPDPLTRLPSIVWTSASSGTIGEAEFEIRLEPDGTYTEDPIHVC